MPEAVAEQQEPLPSILVVYDSPAIRETVSVLTSEMAAAYRVQEIDAGADAIRLCREMAPDLVLLCAMTKDTAAYDICRALKEKSEGFLPVVIYALRTEPEERRRALAAGADDVFYFSQHVDEIALRLRSLIHLRRMVKDSLARAQSLARASAEAADMLLQIEEANRKINEQNEALERMVTELRDRDRRIRSQQAEIQRHLDTLNQELKLASALQMQLLPIFNSEAHPDITIHDRYIPAADLCGDYYDYAALADGGMHISVADVTGHGVAPALVSVQVRTWARTALAQAITPADLLRELNRYMLETFKHDFLMTMVCVHCEPQKQRLVVSGAGHCPAVFLPADGGEPREYPFYGPPLGVTDAALFVEETIDFRPGDQIMLYTDGLSEVMGANDEIYGVGRLLAALRNRPSRAGRDTIEHVVRDARMFAAKGSFDDDVTLVILECRGQGEFSAAHGT